MWETTLKRWIFRVCKIIIISKGNLKDAFSNLDESSLHVWLCNKLCGDLHVYMCMGIFCPTSWLTCERPVRNHISVLPRTDKVIKSLFLSGMHQWIVHQFTTYFPMRVLFSPFSIFTQSWIWKEKLWCKQRGHRGANPSGHSEKEQLQKGPAIPRWII